MKKSLIIGSALLSLVLLTGTAYSVEGPSQTLVFPFICEVPSTQRVFSEHLDMVFTLANVTFVDADVSFLVRNYKSDFLFDSILHLTPHDVASDTCLGIIGRMSSSMKDQMVQTIGDKQYYVGYIEYDVYGASLIGWGEIKTLRTLILGAGKKLTPMVWLFTDTGFNGVPDFYADVNAANTILVGGNNWMIDTRQVLMPRYKIANSDPDTHNWWIIMTPSDALDNQYGSCDRQMECYICNEEEDCVSDAIPIPYEVNIVNVADTLPLPVLFPATTFPRSGFAMCKVVLEAVGTPGGTVPNPCGNAGNEQYLGWSFIFTEGNYNFETSLIFPMHRQITGYE